MSEVRGCYAAGAGTAGIFNRCLPDAVPGGSELGVRLTRASVLTELRHAFVMRPINLATRNLSVTQMPNVTSHQVYSEYLMGLLTC